MNHPTVAISCFLILSPVGLDLLKWGTTVFAPWHSDVTRNLSANKRPPKKKLLETFWPNYIYRISIVWQKSFQSFFQGLFAERFRVTSLWRKNVKQKSFSGVFAVIYIYLFFGVGGDYRIIDVLVGLCERRMPAKSYCGWVGY